VSGYSIVDPNSNLTYDKTIFNYPLYKGTDNSLSIYTADETKVGSYQLRVYASLGVGGYQQASSIVNF
jgi:hypothetical protein